MDDGIFDAQVAVRYDADCGELNEPAHIDPVVSTLASLADGGRALEFAIGTGRIGLPLAAAGVEVHGIEVSNAMVAQMRAKPGGADIPVTIGDMASTRLEGTFSLVYLVFNTITNLLEQRQQLDCFRNAAAHLEPGGHFVVEVLVPRLQRLPMGERFVPFDVSPGHIGIDEYDVVNQRLISHHTFVDGGRAVQWSSPHRYAWPAEYDLMAHVAGMERADRWSDWKKSEFTATSESHVSVWTRSA